MYLQRYIAQLPAAGEIVVFDRSWYNRAGIEHVMGFCSEEQYESFLALCPFVEELIVGNGIQLIKIWLEVGQDEQERRMRGAHRRSAAAVEALTDGPRVLAALVQYSRARDRMFQATDTEHAPWYILRSDDKRRARLNTISHILSVVHYKKVPREKVKLPRRWKKHRYDDQASLEGRRFVPEKY